VSEVTVYKLDHQGGIKLRYSGRVVEQGPTFIRLEAFFFHDDKELGYTVFARGDRFVESYYSDRWYNIFAVYNGNSGPLKGWYCNVCRPSAIRDGEVRCEDLALDVWIPPDGPPLVLDEEEFLALELPAEEQAQCRAAVDELVGLAERDELPR
jgi:predicted RNA-binding protein associated with RNAse of E/G family